MVENETQSRKQSEQVKNQEVNADGNDSFQEQNNQPQQEIQVSPQEKLKSCLQILRKFPVFKYKKVIEAITSLIYEDDDLLNEFLQKIDQPSEAEHESIYGEFLKCEYNRDGDSYRSPSSNKYIPSSDEDLRYPSEDMRNLEINFNKLFKEYTKLYYNTTAVSSCFCWELATKVEEGFCVAVVIKNLIDHSKGIKAGFWDSSHLVVVNFIKDGGVLEAKYKLTSTVFFAGALTNNVGDAEFSGTITKLVSYLLIL